MNTSEIKGAGETAAAGRSQLQLESFFPYVLNRLADSIRVEMPVITMKEHNVTAPEWRILAILAQHGTINAWQIVDLATLEKSTVSRTLKRLTARGLVQQQPARVDHRAKDLALTVSGDRLLRRIAPRVLDWEQDLLQGLEVNEHHNLLYLLDKLDRRMQAQ